MSSFDPNNYIESNTVIPKSENFNCNEKIFLASFITFLILLLLVFIIVLFIYFYYLRDIKQNYQQAFDTVCSTESRPYLELTLPVNIVKYESNIARSLFEISINATISTCPNRIFILPPEFNQLIILDGKNPVDGINRTFGYILYNTTTKWALLVFSASIYTDEFDNVFQYQQVAPVKLNGYTDGELVHQGFYNIYLTIREKILNFLADNTVDHLFITGYSLGAPISTLCAFDLSEKQPIVYIFASPRVGNPKFSFNYSIFKVPHAFSIINTEDIITQLPPAAGLDNWVYQGQTRGIVPFVDNEGTIGLNHTAAYAKSMPFCPGSNPSTPLDVASCLVPT